MALDATSRHKLSTYGLARFLLNVLTRQIRNELVENKSAPRLLPYGHGQFSRPCFTTTPWSWRAPTGRGRSARRLTLQWQQHPRRRRQRGRPAVGGRDLRRWQQRDTTDRAPVTLGHQSGPARAAGPDDGRIRTSRSAVTADGARRGNSVDAEPRPRQGHRHGIDRLGPGAGRGV
jgi:hypothetical protein